MRSTPGDFASTARYLSDMKTAPQMLGHGEAFSPAGVPCARVPARVLRKSIRAASSHAAPTQPRLVTVACMRVKPPTAAPSEKPRYMKDALSERTIGASFTPTIPIKPACCSGKNAHAHNPHAIIASKTAGSAIAGGSTCASVDRLARANASTQRVVRMTARTPRLSVAFPPIIRPTPAEAPHRESAYPTGLFNLIRSLPASLRYEPGVILANKHFVIVPAGFRDMAGQEAGSRRTSCASSTACSRSTGTCCRTKLPRPNPRAGFPCSGPGFLHERIAPADQLPPPLGNWPARPRTSTACRISWCPLAACWRSELADGALHPIALASALLRIHAIVVCRS